MNLGPGGPGGIFPCSPLGGLGSDTVVISYLVYSDVSLIICSAIGFIHLGNFSSARLKGTVSPVSRFLTVTCSKISYKTKPNLSKVIQV